MNAVADATLTVNTALQYDRIEIINLSANKVFFINGTATLDVIDTLTATNQMGYLEYLTPTTPTLKTESFGGGSGGPGAIKLDDLVDVDTVGAVQDSRLNYDFATKIWGSITRSESHNVNITSTGAASYTATLTDEAIHTTSASDNVVNIDINANVPWKIGHAVVVRQNGDGQTEIVPLPGVVFKGDTTSTGKYMITTKNRSVLILKDGVDSYTLDGALEGGDGRGPWVTPVYNGTWSDGGRTTCQYRLVVINGERYVEFKGDVDPGGSPVATVFTVAAGYIPINNQDAITFKTIATTIYSFNFNQDGTVDIISPTSAGLYVMPKGLFPLF